MDPNFSRKNIFMYHDNPSEGPLIVATVKYIEKSCSVNLSHIKVREVQYAKPLLVLVCPIVNKTDQDVNALLDSSRDGNDVMVVIVKRALERAKHKDSLAHLSDPLSTSTRNRVGAACTLYFSGREKFKGYKHENGMAVHEMKRVIGHALDNKPWSTSFPVEKDGDMVDGVSTQPRSQPDSRQIQFVQSSAQKDDPRPLQFVQSTQNPQQNQTVPQNQPVQQSQCANQSQPVQQSVSVPLNRPIPQINVIPPSQPEQTADPFLAPVVKQAPEPPKDQTFDDDFFDPRGEFSKPSANPFGDAFSPSKEAPAEMLHFPKPSAPPKKIRGSVFYFFDDTSPLEQDTVNFIQEQGKFQLKACRRQTATIVSPLIVFSPCYTTPDADAATVLGQCRDGEDVFLVVIEPVYSHSNKQQASLSGAVKEKVGSYGVLSYCLDTKTFVVTDQNSEMISNLRDFILERQALDPPAEEEDEDEDEDEDDDGSTNVLILDGFQDLGFDESEA